MSYLDNYKSMAAGLTRGLRVFRARYGSRFIGTMGLYADLVAEGCRQAFIARLPGHPEQAEDSAAQVGFDRQLTRFKNETITSYKARLQDAWTWYEQGGTAIQVKRAVDIACYWIFPGLFATDNACVVFENGWAQATVVLAGQVPWATSNPIFGSFNWGDANTMYGIANALTEDLSTLKAQVRKWLPSRTIGYLAWASGGPIYGYPSPGTITYGGGSVYTANSVWLTVPVE